MIQEDYSTGSKFKPTIQWMSENYAKANNELFGGALGDCIFLAEPIKSHTRWLGMFKMNPGRYNYSTTGIHLYADGVSRRLFLENSWGERTYINQDNFYELAKPTITLSTYYSGTQDSLYATLVHEMCHYYTYMRGYCPKQAHGPEFRNIGAEVAYRSKGQLTVQRLADAEVMTGYELDDEIKQRHERRAAMKKTNAHYYLIIENDEKIRLTNPTPSTLENILNIERGNRSKVLEIIDPEITNELYESGYHSKMRKYRYWGARSGITKSNPIINRILNNPNTYKIILDNEQK